MIVQRRRGWRSALLTWSTALPGRPFVWGETDCGALVRDALGILFGPELMTFLPAWHTKAEAKVVWDLFPPIPTLRRLGGQQVTLNFLRAGDIIVHGEPDEPVGQQTMSVCIDGRLGITGARSGVTLLDLAAVPQECHVFTLWEANILTAEVATHG